MEGRGGGGGGGEVRGADPTRGEMLMKGVECRVKNGGSGVVGWGGRSLFVGTGFDVGEFVVFEVEFEVSEVGEPVAEHE